MSQTILSQNLSEKIKILSFCGRTVETIIRPFQASLLALFLVSPHELLFPAQGGFYFYVFNVSAASDAQRVIPLSSLIQIRALKAQLRFFCGTNIEEDVEDVAFPVFARFC